MIELITGTLITVVISLAAYFFNKWLGEVEDKISTIRQDVRTLKTTYSEIANEIKSTRYQISAELKELPQLRTLNEKIESIERVKEYLSEEFLPKVQENQDAFGRIIILEKNDQSFEMRLMKIFKAVEILASRLPK